MRKSKIKYRQNKFICPICHLELSMHDVDKNGIVVCPVCGAVIEVVDVFGHKIPIIHDVEIKRPQPLYRLHTMATHISIGLLPLAIFAQIISFFLNWFKGGIYTSSAIEFEQIGFILLTITFLGGLITFATGWTDWKRKYRGRKYQIITKKIRLSVIMFILLGFALVLRNFSGPLSGLENCLYFCVQLISISLMAFMGHLGGFLVFGK
ncbi:MAG: hypothetical protein ISR90_02590 [Candidatus Marinimicrobia bacterium]|nr:hypothetical protein [Candidatus Neomarinimicrobiota bacterium]MBL7022928.1 hypothetical protein [Candidatus Neomarinimicrobiota bacterium]MBL7108746.1 hypothetical protein [Candidatus Neomarinimicrobiota bacterium]